MPNKAFLEITNVCNLDCSFCHKTSRSPRFMTVDEFRTAVERIQGHAEFLYFHLMGEPLLHPDLSDFLEIAGERGFRVIITTNGTLLDDVSDVLVCSASLYKTSISLHSHEANKSGISIDKYLDSCFSFAEKAANNGKISVLRLWNEGSAENTQNDHIIERMHDYFDVEGACAWKKTYSGYKIRDRVFLEMGERFEWPDVDAEYVSDTHSCYGMRDQFGVLCDGTVVPCCLDADGKIPLGNIFTTPLDVILSSERAQSIKNSFLQRKVSEELCRRCGYAAMKKY